MEFIINRNTTIVSEVRSTPVAYAIRNLQRDIIKTCSETEEKGTRITLVKKKKKEECYDLVINKDHLEIQAEDDLGFIYGIYEISQKVLGILPFWFWNDQEMIQQASHVLRNDLQSNPYAVRFRGWFVNDEVLLAQWSINGNKDLPWEMVFEALLRCGGNMVIPGTDESAKQYEKLASSMGLYLTHHHAEPLGAKMFAREYPSLIPSYSLHKEKYEKLWRKGIERQKDYKVIWSLGFRGQGDCPFWENDPQYQTPASRGAVISQIINTQYTMVKEIHSDAICCTNLYGETMELYNQGHLTLPEDIIKIWADNGYGKMVTRRQGNHNPRIAALPQNDATGRHGIYYHVSFYDLQAANHITMLPNTPEFIVKELHEVLEHGVDDFWLINCSNVKPHVYFLDLIATMWKTKQIDIEKHRERYVENYYGMEHKEQIETCLKNYPMYAVPFGNHEDEHAGEQFVNHTSRILISQYLKDKEKRAEELLWATPSETLLEQILWYQNLCEQGKMGYTKYYKQCEETVSRLSEGEGSLFRDSIFLQAGLYLNCYCGATYLCDSLLLAMKGEYMQAFYKGGKAREEYVHANMAMRNREHGKWIGFYQNECLTDIKQTAWVIEGFMSYLRNLDDGPHFYKWQREFLYSEEDRKVMLILNMENHRKDEEIFELMEQRWGK